MHGVMLNAYIITGRPKKYQIKIKIKNIEIHTKMGMNMDNNQLSYTDIKKGSPRVLVMSRRYSDIITSSPVIAKRSKLIYAHRSTVSIVLMY